MARSGIAHAFDLGDPAGHWLCRRVSGDADVHQIRHLGAARRRIYPIRRLDTAPKPPFGVPSVISLSFWGGGVGDPVRADRAWLAVPRRVLGRRDGVRPVVPTLGADCSWSFPAARPADRRRFRDEPRPHLGWSMPYGGSERRFSRRADGLAQTSRASRAAYYSITRSARAAAMIAGSRSRSIAPPSD